MGLVLLALLPFLVRFAYLWQFRYKDALRRPLRYQKAKQMLTSVAVGAIAVGAVVLVIDGDWPLAIMLIVGCLIAEHFEKFHAYQRAVKLTSSYLEGSQQERDQIAMQFVNMEIADGTLI